MRVILVIAIVLLALGAGAAFLPVSVIAGLASRALPELQFTDASGAVWNGKLTGVSYGAQRLGDITVVTHLLPLLGGKAVAQLTLLQRGASGNALISFGMVDSSLEVADLTIDADISLVPGVPQIFAETDGRFLLRVKELRLYNGLCQRAAGDVWTNVLTRLSYHDWVGPELRGPVTCRGGRLTLDASGQARTGESVDVTVTIGPDRDMALSVGVAHAGSGAIKALSELGFEPEGDMMVLRQSVEAR